MPFIGVAKHPLMPLIGKNAGINMEPKSYYVYILGNGKGTLYTGLTNDLERRIFEHRTKVVKGFTAKYNINQLLFFEEFNNIYDALDAEKKIKGWLRKKKLELIRTMNPKFEDLSKDWYDS